MPVLLVVAKLPDKILPRLHGGWKDVDKKPNSPLWKALNKAVPNDTYWMYLLNDGRLVFRGKYRGTQGSVQEYFGTYPTWPLNTSR